MLWILIIIFLLGASFGGLAMKHSNKPNIVGNLRIDKSDPQDGPYYFLEFETNPKTIEYYDYVTLKVKKENFISQN